MGDDKKPFPKKEFFRNPQWWVIFVLFNVAMYFLKFKLLDESSFTILFDVLLLLGLLFLLVELSHDRTFGDTFLDTFILVVILWLIFRIFQLAPEFNPLIP